MPSPIEHSLIGVLIYRCLTYLGAPLQSNKKWYLLWWCIIFSNLSDINILLSWIKLSKAGLTHRGFTHSLLFPFVIALIAVATVKINLSPKRVFGITLVLLLSHVIFDYLSEDDNFPYGIMLFYPFSHEYFMSPFPVLKGFNYRPIERLFSLTNVYNLLFNSTIIIFLYCVLILGSKLFFTKTNHGKS